LNRFWGFLFLLVPVLGTVHIIWAMLGWWPLANHWLPADYSVHGRSIDDLFNIILVLTGVIFVGTGVFLAFEMWKFGKEDSRAVYYHGNHLLELSLAVFPAIILIFLSFYQLEAWEDQRMRRPQRLVDGTKQQVPPLIRVTGRQFAWDFQYAGADEIFGTSDDVLTNTVMAVPIESDVVIQLESSDVLHSFFIPSLRIKQDIVPGMAQFVWFRATQPANIDLVCTELCGWGHYKMRGQVRLMAQADYDQWYQSELDKKFAGPPTNTDGEFEEPSEEEQSSFGKEN
jgi:cytochrome c oxidase subunit II